MTAIEELQEMAKGLLNDEYASASDKLIVRAILELEERLERIIPHLPDF